MGTYGRLGAHRRASRVLAATGVVGVRDHRAVARAPRSSRRRRRSSRRSPIRPDAAAGAEVLRPRRALPARRHAAGLPRAPRHRRRRTSRSSRKLRALQQLRPGTHVQRRGQRRRRADRAQLPQRRATRWSRSCAEANGFYRVTDDRAQLDTRIAMKSGVIRSSLFAATDDAGIPDSVAMQLADVFGGDIDFHRDLRKGDRFSVVYELHHLGGRPVRAGPRARRRVHQQRQDLPRGALRQRLLRARRQEPAQGVPALAARVLARELGLRHAPPPDRAGAGAQHKGIDYAAPTGTRVRAVGDGVVEFAGAEGRLRQRGRSCATTASTPRSTRT